MSGEPPGLAEAKRKAAFAAVELVTDGMVIGIGTGTTARFLIQALSKRVREGLRIHGVPTSLATKQFATDAMIPLLTLEDKPHLDLDIDGADEIDPDLNVLKGGGGALLQEKIVALASSRLVIIADQSKLVKRLTETRAIPVEVVAFGWKATSSRIVADVGGEVAIRGGEATPYRTDGGHVILDLLPSPGSDVFALTERVKALTGVVDHGVFRHIASTAVIGYLDGTVRTVTPETF